MDAPLRRRARTLTQRVSESRRARSRSRWTRGPASCTRSAARAHAPLGRYGMNAPAGPDLRDIHLPPAPSWWPPAPGWWLLAIVLLIAIAAGAWMLLRVWRERRWRQRVMTELDRIATLHAAQPNSVGLATDVSQLLRRA